MYKFNENKLLFEKTNILFKYKIVIGVLLLSVFILSFSAIKTTVRKEELKEVISKKDSLIQIKNNRIKAIKEPLREETYVEDLYKNIGFKLTKEQYKRFSYLALKYKTQIEEAKVPATLVWWTSYKESRFDINAKSTESTACGQFQFLKGTWEDVCKMEGFSKEGRFKEEKQVTVMLAYLNYLYRKYGSWERGMVEYHGGEYQYPIKFLFK